MSTSAKSRTFLMIYFQPLISSLSNYSPQSSDLMNPARLYIYIVDHISIINDSRRANLKCYDRNSLELEVGAINEIIFYSHVLA